MHVLICSDGTASADQATRLAGVLLQRTSAAVTLLGIEENPRDRAPLRAALEQEANILRGCGLDPQIIIREGEPIRQIFEQTTAAKYDLAVIGTRGKGIGGIDWRSDKTYELIKAIQPPVLVATGSCDRLKRFLLCTGGKSFIDEAVQLTGKLAAAAGASVTLLHVMAEPPAIYADLVQLEEDVDRLLESKSELGRNLRRQKEDLNRLGVPAEVRVRHGIVVDQVFEEVQKGDYDLIVTGSSHARGLLRHYIMGDVTRSILNRANRPVLVARAGEAAGNFWTSLKRLFGATREPGALAH